MSVETLLLWIAVGLIAGWLASAVVDKDAMTLTLGIRPVPADVGLLFTSARPVPERRCSRAGSPRSSPA